MPTLYGVEIEDTFAEAFTVVGARLVVTAETAGWARIAGATATGNATSVIACDCEAGIEAELAADQTPDGRPGVSLLFFGFSRDALAVAVQRRTGQCLLTCATTACYDGLPETPRDRQIPLGKALRYFGDGFQHSKLLAGQRYWRVPVMDGEFVCVDRIGTVKGVGGGNLLICGIDQAAALTAAEAAAAAMRAVPGVILPFPGGIVRSGSKVGSRYKALKASTNDAYCPTLRGITPSALPEGCAAVYEIVADGLTFDAVQAAMRAGLHAAAAAPGVLRITAGNYGGQLGKHHFHLRDLVTLPDASNS